MPQWAVQGYLNTKYVVDKRLGKKGLRGELYAVSGLAITKAAYMQDFLQTLRKVSFSRLPGLTPLAYA